MDTPFPYSQYVTGKNFVGRRAEVTLVANLLGQGENVLLMEPPKSGKTSLIQQALFSMRMSGKPFTVGQFSALNTRTPEAFLLKLGGTVLKMAGSSPAEYASLAQKYLGGTHFVFDPDAFANQGQILSLSWSLDPDDIRAMLRFPYVLARTAAPGSSSSWMNSRASPAWRIRTLFCMPWTSVCGKCRGTPSSPGLSADRA